mmetsp:Transcript_1549/g.3435  ORF Transcript_1549/g.3435 Transcript_1549/m.3435 type:complete len:207 (-) Transcript_1549:160-780(-)|eukprot:CAMPEP_0117471068 /NCGR_PEP_ID=MMETSP0784-20121206/7544_1 /TAXON_ID=39447 /ORGANISM="" /LENGTH=206 /DNA_ID=CAMNT_0005265183 /DNA_START=32 /DNA_END=652 /DNA_ORIENTATION=-
MSKRKGLSFDEKKSVLLAAMHAEGSFYTLKELENLGKSKGVIPQAVKEVVEALCADGAIHNDKVGTQSLFWALASEQAAALRTKKQRLEDEIRRMENECRQLESELAETGGGQPTEQDVAELQARAAAERKRRDQLREQVKAFERCGPGKIAEMQRQIVIAKEAANRWADNICSVRSMFVRERRGEVSTEQFNRTFELPEDFDYLE